MPGIDDARSDASLERHASAALAVRLTATSLVSRPAPATLRTAVGSQRRPRATTSSSSASESVDRVALIRFGPNGAKVEQRAVRRLGADGSRRVRTASPCRRTRSTTSCRPRTARRSDDLTKYNAETNAAEGNVMLGNFPATAQVSPDGYYVYVVNFNLHGDMVPSDVSVVAADEMVEIARIRDLHDAARVAHERRRHEALLGVHDG